MSEEKKHHMTGPQHYRAAEDLMFGMVDTLTSIKKNIDEMRQDPIGLQLITQTLRYGMMQAQVHATLAQAAAQASTLEPVPERRARAYGDWLQVLQGQELR